MGSRILVVDDDTATRGILEAALKPDSYDLQMAFDGASGLAAALAAKPHLIILEVILPDMDGYELCARLRRDPATLHTPVMMLTAATTLEAKIRGFEVGADDYMTKPFEAAELRLRVAALLKRARPAKTGLLAKMARQIAVFSLRGGAGVSTFASNLAVALRQMWGHPVCLVDMVVTAGQAALMLNVPLRRTWVDLAAVPLAEHDWELIGGHLLTHASGARVLAAPLHTADGELVTVELAKTVIRNIRQQFEYVVVDCPHDFRDTTLAALDSSDAILLLLTPDLAGVRAAAMALEVFESLGYQDDRIHLVINWTFQKRGLARKDIEEALHHSARSVMPFDGDRFPYAINTGVPVVESDPSAQVAAVFEDLAFRLSRPEHQKSAPTGKPAPALQRVLSRLEATRQARGKA